MDLRRHHFQVIVVTLVAVVLVWTTLSWQTSQDNLHSLGSGQIPKTTASSSSRADHLLYHHDYDGRSVHSSSTTTFSTTRPHWIDSYIQWHQEQLRFNATKYSFVMYSCTRQGGACGGIGDRLNGMVQTFYTAMCHRRVFLIQYDTPFPLTVALQPNHIRWNVTPGGRNIPTVERIDWMNDRSYPSLIEPNVLQEKEDLRKARGWLIRCNLWMEKTMPTSKCLQQYIQEQEENDRRRSSNPSVKKERQSSRNDPMDVPDADDLYRWAFDALFQLSEPVMERTRQIQQRTGLAITTTTTTVENTPTKVDITLPDDGAEWNATSSINAIVTSNDQHQKNHPIVSLQPYVAMHIRTGRGSTWSSDPLRHSGNQTLMKFRECAMRMQQQLAMKQQSIAATAAAAARTKSTKQQNALGSTRNHRLDSLATPSLPLIYVASDNVAIKQQLEDMENTSFRFDHSLNVVHVDKTLDPTLDSYLDAWAEMVVLWQAKALVMSVSKFSQLAAVLGKFTNATARYFDQCEFDDNSSSLAISESGSGETISLQETATPTHHRDQADEKFIETRRSMRWWFSF